MYMKNIYLILLITFSTFCLLGQNNKPNHQLNEWKNDSIPLGYEDKNEKVEIKKSEKSFTGNTSMKITFNDNQRAEKNLSSDVIGKFAFTERPDSLLGILYPKIGIKDTVLIIATLFKDDIDRPIGESFIEVTGKNKQNFNKYQSRIKYFSSFKPDSLQIDIIFVKNSDNEENSFYVDYLNFSYDKYPIESSAHYQPIKLYPNPTNQGHIYSVQNPGSFDNIFVKNISTDKVIFKASSMQLKEKEIKIDLGDAGVGEYYVIFQNKSTTIRRRIEIK